MTRKGRIAGNLIVAWIATLILAVSALAQDSETVLHTFSGGHDGAVGGSHLVADSAGNLYGTAFAGGNQSTRCEPYTGLPGCGVVFELTRTGHGTWKETVLHTFTAGKDGGIPTGGVILDSAGNLYGTTLFGGDHKPVNCQASGSYPPGCGVVFKLTPTEHGPWKETVLYTFTGGADGNEPWGNLTFDSSGNLYGSTSIGGNLSCGSYGCGVIFKLTPGDGGPRTESVLYTFNGGTDGGFPYSAGLTFDSSGNLYGVTKFGGDLSVNCQGGPGCGVVYQLAPTPSGHWTETVLHSFTGGKDGGSPLFGVTLDASRNVYGTTIWGGDTNSPNCLGGGGLPPGCGVVYELTQGTWEETVLYTFSGGSDGAFGFAPVQFDSSGNLYGEAAGGGNFVGSSCQSGGCGVVFELTPANQAPWTESVLYTFTGGTDGSGPESNLLFDASGNLYGVTENGGNDLGCGGYGCGVVFELQPPQDHAF
jgi:uncharacterized repeat protein (TIGR03803 family)